MALNANELSHFYNDVKGGGSGSVSLVKKVLALYVSETHNIASGNTYHASTDSNNFSVDENDSNITIDEINSLGDNCILILENIVTPNATAIPFSFGVGYNGGFYCEVSYANLTNIVGEIGTSNYVYIDVYYFE